MSLAAGAFTLETRSADAVFRSGERRLRIGFVTDVIARVTLTEGKPFLKRESRIVTGERDDVAFELEDEGDRYRMWTSGLTIVMHKATGALEYADSGGKLLLREPERGGKWLTARAVTRNVFERDTDVEVGQSIDGARATATAYTTVFDRDAFEAKLEFEFSEDEALFGLGSHEDGFANLRGRARDLYQQNMKVVVPHLVSTRGWGLLLDCGSLMTFHDDALGSYWWADCVDELDFYFIGGGTFAGVMRGYRRLTGATPLPPKWALGYVQSKERYVNATEMVAVVAEYRRRRVPLDVVVLDWKSWPNGAGWGQKSLDPIRFPDPDGFTRELHAMGARLMVSIWPIMTGGCEDQRELLDRGLMLGNKSTYNAFLKEARMAYWEQAERGLFAHGVDAWWCDCTEPFEADWAGAVKPELDVRLAMNTGESKRYLDTGEINTYSLAHSAGIYEGQRRVTEAKRVLNLTRSGYAGQHRYGTFTWNGDVCATWETLRHSVAEGLNFCATGEAYWTVDVGGFFVGDDPERWFWRGDYRAGCRGLTDMNALEPDPNDAGCTDLGFRELYTRWLQYAVFLPMMRSHGTDAAREIWRFGDEGSRFYDVIAESIRLRYRLMPYLYSLAAAVTFDGLPMVRALALEFPDDQRTHAIGDQYMFGPALMVCPVLEPMYYGPNSEALGEVAKSRAVYLPAGQRWHDFWCGELVDGGQTAEATAPIERIPLFVRGGSILLMSPVMQFVDEVRDGLYAVHVYTGADAEFTLYEDDGDGYDYERGAWAKVLIRWNDARRELTLSDREGGFAGLVSEREISVEVHAAGGSESRTVRYDGASQRIVFTMDEEPL